MKFIALLLLLTSCFASPNTDNPASAETQNIASLHSDYRTLFSENPRYLADGFDFPVGPPNAKGYYNAQKFKENNHLGDDWNGTGGGNTDLGDAVYSIANGYVTEARDEGAGWGNVVRIVHCWKEGDETKMVESLYAHLDEMKVQKGQWLTKGTQIGTIGNANGAYYAHLHLEIRTQVDMDLGGGYSRDTMGFVNPTRFIGLNRSF